MAHLSTAERIGRDSGRKELILELIAEKFGPLTEETIARINRMTRSQINRLGKKIMTASTLDELGLASQTA